jgi:hypothetical protein
MIMTEIAEVQKHEKNACDRWILWME